MSRNKVEAAAPGCHVHYPGNLALRMLRRYWLYRGVGEVFTVFQKTIPVTGARGR